jgi:hypothetical protein
MRGNGKVGLIHYRPHEPTPAEAEAETGERSGEDVHVLVVGRPGPPGVRSVEEIVEGDNKVLVRDVNPAGRHPGDELMAGTTNTLT